MTITFTVALPPRGLRTNRRTPNTAYHARLVREYQEAVWCAGAPGYHRIIDPGPSCPICDVEPWERARLRLTWRHAGVASDEDNALASLKALIDVLKATGPRPLGIVVDDSPAHLTTELVTEKVSHRRDECVVVEITREDG